MTKSRRLATISPSVGSTRQPLRFLGWIAVYSVLVCLAGQSDVFAQLYDSLDAYPPRWQLDTSDCNARVVEQRHLTEGGVGGGSCETLTFTAGNGSEAFLVYRIEPVRPLDDLTAQVALMCVESGASIGLRVRFPYYRDGETRRPIAVVIYGAKYESPGEFQTVGIGGIERELRLKMMSLRQELGSQVDLRDPYVDAVVVNAYTGPGSTSIRLDELKVTGMVSMYAAGTVPGHASRLLEGDYATLDRQHFVFLIPKVPVPSDHRNLCGSRFLRVA